MPLLAALALQAATVPSTFLTSGKDVYLPSPAYAIAQVGPDARFKWSPDGMRLAFVEGLAAGTPLAIERKIGRGEDPGKGPRLGVWDAASGRVRDVLAGVDPALGVGRFEFMGRDLVFTASTGDGQDRLWIAPEVGPIRPIDIQGLEGFVQLVASRRQKALVVSDRDQAWLLTPSRTLPILLPQGASPFPRGVTADDRAILWAPHGKEAAFVTVDFTNGKAFASPEEPQRLGSASTLPFVLDLYAVGYTKDREAAEQGAKAVDDRPFRSMEEDGGYRLDLVERAGSSRRRLPLALDLARPFEVSENGLSYAYVTNRILTVRRLVKAEEAVAARLAGP